MNTIAKVDFGGAVTDMVSSFLNFIPNLLGALAILLIGWFIAKVLYRLIARVLSKMGIDRLVDRSGLGGPLERAGYPDAAVFLAKILYVMMLFVVVSLAIQALGIPELQSIFDQLIAWIPNLFIAALIIFLVGAVANFVREALRSATATQSWGNLVTNIAFASIWFLGGTMAIDQLGFASGIVNGFFSAVMSALAGILIIMFGVGGIWSARDRFWPGVFDSVSNSARDTSDRAETSV